MKKFLVSIKDGKIENPQKLSEHIKQRKDGLYKVMVTKQWTRSTAQNSYYWWVVLELIEEHTGVSKEELHYFFKHKLLEEDFPSTAEQNKIDFAKYVDQIKDFASAEFGILIPDAQN